MPNQQKEYLSMAEVADLIGIKRASLYYYIRALNIQTHKFPLNKRVFISASDVERIKAAKDNPWTLSSSTEEDAA